MDRFLPDGVMIHEITYDNVCRYFRFPSYMMELVQKGDITLTHLSDILRAALLYRYGGVWLDATYLLTGPLADDFLHKGFYSVKQYSVVTEHDVTQGKWTQSLMCANKGNPLIEFLLNAFCIYWAKEKKLIEYYLIDSAYRNLSFAQQMIDMIRPSMPDLFSLQWILPQFFDEKKWLEINETTQIFKLTYKFDLLEWDADGNRTFYGHILHEYLKKK